MILERISQGEVWRCYIITRSDDGTSVSYKNDDEGGDFTVRISSKDFPYGSIRTLVKNFSH